MRRDWAAGYARHLAPGALLACLAFPITPAGEHQTGPPWPVKPQDYKDVLLPLGESVLQAGNCWLSGVLVVQEPWVVSSCRWAVKPRDCKCVPCSPLSELVCGR